MARSQSPKRSLWTATITARSLEIAWLKVQANRGAAGGDNVTLGQFRKRLGANLKSLAVSLADGSYRPGPYRRVDIPKRKGGFRRLMIPGIQDRIVHTAVAETLKPILEPMFEDSSFAYRPGKSVKQAVARIERWRNQGYHYVIEADIVGYFDAIRHDMLLAKLGPAINRHPGSPRLLDLIEESLEHQAAELGTEGRGLVQGSPMSPILANLYLDALDEAIDGRGVKIVRFADDFVVLCKSQNKAEAALQEVRDVLNEHGLSLHDDGTRIVDFDKGFDFVGHLFVRSLAVKKTYDDELTDNSTSVVDTSPAPGAAKVAHTKTAATFDQGPSVIYMTDPSQRLALRNESFSIRTTTDHEVAAISHLRVGRIEIGPRVKADQNAIEHCIATDTDIAFVDGYGEIRARLEKPVNDRAELQIEQARCILDSGRRGVLARKIVEARIKNQRTQLFRLNRSSDKQEVKDTLVQMGRLLRKIPDSPSLEQLRGFEGSAAALYWPALASMTRNAPMPFRRTRPAIDAFNATINYLTAVLERDIRIAINRAGLNIGFGILHEARDYADAAIYDLMEPFRAALTEGLPTFLFNSRRLKPDMFGPADNGPVRIERQARHAIIRGYEQAVVKRVNITGRKGKLAWRPMMQRQAYDLANALRSGDLDAFQPYLMEA